jgi:hypothetical protein
VSARHGRGQSRRGHYLCDLYGRAHGLVHHHGIVVHRERGEEGEVRGAGGVLRRLQQVTEISPQHESRTQGSGSVSHRRELLQRGLSPRLLLRLQ